MALWFMRDTQIALKAGFESSAGTTLVGEGDFNGDGIGDVHVTGRRHRPD